MPRRPPRAALHAEFYFGLIRDAAAATPGGALRTKEKAIFWNLSFRLFILAPEESIKSSSSRVQS
eukprot:scaffold9715_cov113-Isochrysis_galbana.AAC.19